MVYRNNTKQKGVNINMGEKKSKKIREVEIVVYNSPCSSLHAFLGRSETFSKV